MNCKPNELAVIVRPSPVAPILGMIVTTLYVAPEGEFVLPDGYPQMAIPRSFLGIRWVVEFPNPVCIPINNGRVNTTRMARFGTVPDSFLRPIRWQDGEDETLSSASHQRTEVQP